MLAELPENKSLKSIYISQRMGVSHSYLQKICRKLNQADLVISHISKKGGYQLNKEIDEITFLDIFNAIEGERPFLSNVNLQPIIKMFVDIDTVREKSEEVSEIHL